MAAARRGRHVERDIKFPVKPLPFSDVPVLIRTDFSSPDAWAGICERIRRPDELFRASLTFIDDAEFAGLTPDNLRTGGYFDHQTFAFFADHMTMTHVEHPVLVVFVFEDSHVEFRAIPSEIPAIETNLSLGNMDPEDFAESAGTDGIFRGF